jgi:hypothetical protein
MAMVVRSLRGHLSYANVVATLALLFAMSGGALAASHYLISSTKQISPKVLAKLKGRIGPPGPAGSPGATGPTGLAGGTRTIRGLAGATGPAGSEGPEGPRGIEGSEGFIGLITVSSLPEGGTESGDFALASDNSNSSGIISEALTYPIPLETTIPSSKIVYTTIGGRGNASECPGPGEAAPGYLCIYAEAFGVRTPAAIRDPSTNTFGAGRIGFSLEWEVLTAGAFARGTYTITAP